VLLEKLGAIIFPARFPLFMKLVYEMQFSKPENVFDNMTKIHVSTIY
jgi:hypothetical protein